MTLIIEVFLWMMLIAAGIMTVALALMLPLVFKVFIDVIKDIIDDRH